jgi:hypothetical protein
MARGGDGESAGGGGHGQREAEGGDHLQQEKPADRRDRPVAGQVQVEIDRPGGDQQTRTHHVEQYLLPIARQRPCVFPDGSRNRCPRFPPGHRVAPCHRVSPFCRCAGEFDIVG